MSDVICVTCGRPERDHSGPERFCSVRATFRESAHPPLAAPAPVSLLGMAIREVDWMPKDCLAVSQNGRLVGTLKTPRAMSEKIEPALSAADWAVLQTSADERGESLADYLDASQAYPTKSIALANAALPDSDPRKITREKVEHLKRIHWDWRQATRDQSDQQAREAWAARTWELIDALASYLPPESA